MKPTEYPKPKGPFSRAVEKAISFAQSDEYALLYLKAEKVMGPDLLLACVRDSEDQKRALDCGDDWIKCPGAYLTTVIRQRLGEFENISTPPAVTKTTKKPMNQLPPPKTQTDPFQEDPFEEDPFEYSLKPYASMRHSLPTFVRTRL